MLATAPRAAEDPYTTPAGERPLPWEYDYEDVASYWAQRWAPARSGRQTHARTLYWWQHDSDMPAMEQPLRESSLEGRCSS